MDILAVLLHIFWQSARGEDREYTGFRSGFDDRSYQLYKCMSDLFGNLISDVYVK